MSVGKVKNKRDDESRSQFPGAGIASIAIADAVHPTEIRGSEVATGGAIANLLDRGAIADGRIRR